MFKFFNWSKKTQSVDNTPIPQSFVIPHDHQLINVNMAVDDDLVDISVKPLTYAEAAKINKHEPTTVVTKSHSRKKATPKASPREIVDDQTDQAQDKYNHYEKNRVLKKKQYIHLQKKKIESAMRKQAVS